jgi:hypothetical protein
MGGWNSSKAYKGNISAAAFNFIVQEPKAIIECVNDKSLRSNLYVTHQAGFRMMVIEHVMQ